MKKSNLKEGELLLQQIYKEDSWKLLICCILQNLTTGKQIRPMLDTFFEKYPLPLYIIDADPIEMEEILRPLGMQKKRVITLKKFCDQYLNKQWKQPIELYGIGQYAQDSYDIFIKHDYTVQPTDKELVAYLNKMVRCDHCDVPLGEDYEIKMCCNGYQCGCMGRPIEPIVCSQECFLLHYPRMINTKEEQALVDECKNMTKEQLRDHLQQKYNNE